jgi:hypothetical protein
MAIEVTAPMVSRLLIHIRETLMQEIDQLKSVLPEDMERHTQKVYVGKTPANLIQMVAERTKKENWQELPTGDPVVLDGLKALVDEINGYLDTLPHD